MATNHDVARAFAAKEGMSLYANNLRYRGGVASQGMIITSYRMPIAFWLRNTHPGEDKVFIGNYRASGRFISATTSRHVTAVGLAVSQLHSDWNGAPVDPELFERLFNMRSITEQVAINYVNQKGSRS